MVFCKRAIPFSFAKTTVINFLFCFSSIIDIKKQEIKISVTKKTLTTVSMSVFGVKNVRRENFANTLSKFEKFDLKCHRQVKHKFSREKTNDVHWKK